MFPNMKLGIVSIILPFVTPSKESLLKLLSIIKPERNIQTSVAWMLDGYGCWCYFDGLQGHGPILDHYDQKCKDLQHGYRCAAIDGKSELENCSPLTVAYNPIMQSTYFQAETDFTPIIDQCIDFNQGSLCAQRTCILETVFLKRILSLPFDQMAGNFSLLHDSLDVDGVWGVRIGSGANVKRCCGDYPFRQPYNEAYFQCCGGSVQQFC